MQSGMTKRASSFLAFACMAAVAAVSFDAYAGKVTARNPPECDKNSEDCGCDNREISAACIKVNLDLGETTPWTGSMPCALKIFADSDSPNVFSQDSLYAVLGGYTFKRLGHKTMADSVTPAEVVFAHPQGEPVHFVFADGESWGRPDPGVHIKMDERLMMVDSEGWAATHDPVYYDLYLGDGSRRRFLATNMTGALGQVVSITDARGRTMTPEEMGIEIIYDSNGVRQFLTPSRLADVTPFPGFQGFEVKVYPLQEVPAKDAATGLYVPPQATPVKHLQVRPENGWRRALVTLRSGGNAPRQYVFDYALNDWSLTHSSGVEERKEREIADGRAAYIKNEIIAADGTLLSRKVKNYSYESWGFAMTNKVEGFGGVTDTTEWTYYTSGNGKGQVKTEKRQSGLLTQYTYDSVDRVTSETRSGPDMMTEVTTYNYTPVDPSDPVLPVDTRPRTVVKTLAGIECERTYYVYSPLTNIVERVGTQGAPYGGTNALRTITTFYPIETGIGNGESGIGNGESGIGNGESGIGNGESVGGDHRAPRSGFVQSIRHEDGTLDTYDYSLVSNLWVETVTHLHEQSPSPVSGKTTRDITTTNYRGEILEEKTEACIGEVWYTIARNRMTYNSQGKRIQSENLAGQTTTTAWDCCHKVSETQPDGSTTTWDYDIEGRMIASSRLIPLNMTNVTWLTTCYEYDDLGRQTATWQTNLAAHVGLPATRTRYDQLGRVVASIDQLGNTTATTYSPDGRIVSVQNPNTSTTTIAYASGGDVLSITGSAGTPLFYSTGISQSGMRWTREVYGESINSSRFAKRHENMLGQIVREECSGFRDAVLSTVHLYDSYGHLVRTCASGEPVVEFSYDSLGEQVALVRTVSPGAMQNSESEWRRTAIGYSFALADSGVWLAETNAVTCSDASIEQMVASSSRQLTGGTAYTPFRARYIDIRGNSTEEILAVSNSVAYLTTAAPYATNTIMLALRYGVPMMDISSACVTNFYEYDSLGRRVASTGGRGNTTHLEYDAFGYLSAAIDPLGNRTSYAYDRFGNLAAVTNALGDVTCYEYDLRGRKILEYGATYPVRYAYDIFGNMTSMTTFRHAGADLASAVEGDTTSWLYDEALGVMTNKIYADGKRVSYAYSDDGKLVSRIWARGVATVYSYDILGNVRQIDYSDGTPTVTFYYDALGRKRLVQDAAGSTIFSYDSFGALTNETVTGITGSSTIERSLDCLGRLTGYALDGVRQTTVGYDPVSGRVVSLLVAGVDVPFTWSYLPNSSLKSSLAYPNGLLASWQYDEKDQLLQVRNSVGASVVSQYDYTYDAVGLRARIARSGFAMGESCVDACAYNSRAELISVVKNEESAEYQYAYDDIGNRTTASELEAGRTDRVLSSYVANSLNQYTSISSSARSAESAEEFIPLFDDDGNQTLVKTATGVWSVEYNGENRPVIWSCGETNIVMTYDIMGRRAQSVEIVRSSTNRIDNFTYDGFRLVSRRRIASDGAVTIDRFVWDVTEPIATRPLVFYVTDGNPQYYSHDGNKNVSELTSPGNALSAHYEYAPFGAVTAVSGDFGFVHGNPFRFSAEYADDTLGLVNYNYRAYNPQDGRWLSRDPFLESPDMNGYLMCRNSPIGLIDVLGLWWTLEHRQMVKIAMDRIRCRVHCLKNDKAYETVVDQIADGNAHMDTKKEYRDDLPLHYNRPMDNKNDGEKMVEVNILKAKHAYKKGLEDRRSKIDKDLDNKPTMKQCDDALEQMGQLTHMLQDYYGHGVDKNYKYCGDMYLPLPIEVRKSMWSGDVGYCYGSPDSAPEKQMKPSSYEGLLSGSEHGGLSDGEPGHRTRAPDSEIRKNASIIVTANVLQSYMQKWCEKCCEKTKAIEEEEMKKIQRRIDAMWPGISRLYIDENMCNSCFWDIGALYQ